MSGLILFCVILIAGVISCLGAVTINWAQLCTVTETLSGNTDAVKSADLTKTIVQDQFDDSGTLTADTTPSATKAALFTKALSAGAGTIDLTALPGLNNATVNGTGLKLQLLKLKNLGANAMTVSTGASNGYAIGDGIIIPPGGMISIYGHDGYPDIASGAKTIDIAGTAAQTCEVTAVMG